MQLILHSHHEFSVLPVNKKKPYYSITLQILLAKERVLPRKCNFLFIHVCGKENVYICCAKLEQILSISELICSFKCGRTSLCERGQCLDRIAESSLNHLERPSFSVSQKSVRDRLKILERDFKKKERSEKNASGISPERTEVDQIMEDYLEEKEDQEKESEKASEESRDKMAKEKATEDMRNKAMERLSETKKRGGSDLPKKKRKTMEMTLWNI